MKILLDVAVAPFLLIYASFAAIAVGAIVAIVLVVLAVIRKRRGAGKDSNNKDKDL